MDLKKCQSLKDEFVGQPEPQCVPIERFFDGNDEEASIGCNLSHHPGMDVFRNTLVGLLKHPQVTGVWARISELDPGEDMWPFADAIVVAGTISESELSEIVENLFPDEVWRPMSREIPESLRNQSSPIQFVWWD